MLVAMRSYGEYCAVAKSLDVIGDRWTLLIVRELLLRGGCRYTDLRAGLPGVATNLLAERLRELEAAGVVAREEAPPPVATTLFSLTERGRALEPVLRELLWWGIPYMAQGPAPEDAFRSHWFAWPVQMFLTDRAPAGPPIQIALRLPDEELTLDVGDGDVRVRAEAAAHPDAALIGPAYAILAVITGHREAHDAGDLGLSHEGDLSVLRRLMPAGTPG